MSAAPSQGIEPHRRRRHHRQHDETIHPCGNTEETRPKVNPIFLWASQCEQKIIEVRCEDYDKRNRIKLTKTAQGWRSIPRTASNSYAISAPLVGSSTTGVSLAEKENDLNKDQPLRISMDSYVKRPLNNLLDNAEQTADQSGVRRKRKKYTFVKNHKRRRGLDVTSEKSSGESKLNKAWKSKRRRKVGKHRRVTRITRKSEEDMDDEDDETDVEKKGKRRTTLDVDVDRKRNIEEKSKVEKTISETLVKNFSDIEKMTKNRLLQPRVVLEQLRLSQLPKRVYRNSFDAEDEDLLTKNERRSADADDHVNYENEEEEHNDADDEAFDGDDDEEDCEDERLQCDKKSTVMAKDDLQEILNMLDANDFSNDNLHSVVSIENNKKMKNFANNNCLEPDKFVELMKESKSEINADNFVSEEKLPNIVTSLSYFISENNTREIEQSEILDTAKNEERQTICNIEPNCAQTDHSKNSDNSLDKNLDYNKSGLHITTETKTTSSTEKTIPTQVKPCFTDSSSILKALQSTPGLSVSIATKLRSSEQTECLTKKAVSSSRSPDSQTEISEKSIPSPTAKNIVFTETTSRNDLEMKNLTSRRLPEISIAIPVYKNLFQKSQLTIPSPVTKNRVESPESTTTNIPKPDEVINDTESHESNEVGENDLQTLKAFENRDNRQNHAKSVSKNIPQLQPIDTARLLTYPKSKVHVNLPISMSNRNNEAQAKMTNHRDVEDKQGIKLKSRNVISIQPFGFNATSATVKNDSETMNRILPSPPCSVSCSEDAKNNIPFKNFLLSPQNTNLLEESISTLSHHIDVMSKMNEEFSKTREESQFINRLLSSNEVHSSFIHEQVPYKRPMSAECSDAKYSKKLSQSSQNSKQMIYAINKSGDYPFHLNTDVDPSSQLRDLIKTSGHMIPDPLLVPRDYLPSLAAAPAVEIPKLLLSRPELRLPEAFSKPELLRDPNLLVISLAHLQQVLDQNDISHSKIHSPMEQNNGKQKNNTECKSPKPKLSCKPIGTLMPSPMDLSNNRRHSPCPPLLRVRSGLMKQESEVSSTANSPDDMHLWHPLFGSQKRYASWHRTTLAS